LALIFNSTISDPLANSYCSADWADDYFAALPKATTNKTSLFWAALQDGEKEQLLIAACWTIEQLKFTIKVDYPGTVDVHLEYDNINHMNYYSFPGNDGLPVKFSPFQSLQFPRNRDMYATGLSYIPERVMIAQCEQAFYDSQFDDSAMALAEMGVTKDFFTGGGIQTSQDLQIGGTNLSPVAKRRLAPFILKKVKKFERA
jgi:hypothetical protein